MLSCILLVMPVETDTHTAEEQQPQEKFDAIIALGKNWRLPIEGSRIYLSIESKITAIAAGQMYVDGRAGGIIFSTGQTAGINKEIGQPYPTEAEEMKRFMRIYFNEDQIPESAIKTEAISFDTAGNAEEVKKILEDEKLKKVAVLTIGSHKRRSGKIFANYGVSVTAIASQDVLKNRNGHYDKFLNEYAWSTRHAKELLKETILNTLLFVDPKGEKLRAVTTKSRNRNS